MISFADRIAELESEGYANGPAMAKLAHDIMLKAIEKSGFAKHVTIKGGVVMSAITGDIRRATIDMDMDFVRYGLTDENIDLWIMKLNCIDGIRIVRRGEIADLKHQNYRGKRVYLDILDNADVTVSTKLDIGVHVHERLPQKPLAFTISLDESTAMLPANTKEQIFAEKLRSLLRFGTRSMRAKDIFDLYYLASIVEIDPLRRCIAVLVLDDESMRENDFIDIRSRVRRIFDSAIFMKRLGNSNANWLNVSTDDVSANILRLLDNLAK